MQARVLNLIAGVFVIAVIATIGFQAYSGFFGTNSAAAGSGKLETGTIAAAMKGLAFPDGNRTIAVGTTVVWTNYDGAIHTITSSDHTSFDSSDKAKGETYSMKFTSIGKYDYFCKTHPFMTASITVVQPYGGN